MNHRQQVFYFRLAATAILAVLLYVSWTPSFSSLKTGTGQVISVRPHASTIDARFQIVDGPVIQCAGKRTSKQCPYDSLLPLLQSHENVTLWYQGDKVWQAQTVNGIKIIDYDAIRGSRALFIWLGGGMFFLMIVFAPLLIQNKDM